MKKCLRKIKRNEYLNEIAEISIDNLVYIDESGIDHQITKEHCWTIKGSNIIGERSGKDRRKTSVMAALNGNEINAPIRFGSSAFVGK